MDRSQLRVRRMTYSDTAKVMRIDDGRGQSAMTYEDIEAYTLGTNSVRGIVGELDDTIVAFALFSFPRHFMQVETILVAEAHRRNGFGRALLSRIITEAINRDKVSVKAVVPERNLSAQLFFRESGLNRSKIHVLCGKKLEAYLLWRDLV